MRVNYSLTIYLTDRKCPECSAPLLSNGPLVWCSRDDRPGVPACSYGVAEKVRTEDAPPPVPR